MDDGVGIATTLYTPVDARPSARPAVMLFHGLGGNRQSIDADRQALRGSAATSRSRSTSAATASRAGCSAGSARASCWTSRGCASPGCRRTRRWTATRSARGGSRSAAARRSARQAKGRRSRRSRWSRRGPTSTRRSSRRTCPKSGAIFQFLGAVPTQPPGARAARAPGRDREPRHPDAARVRAGALLAAAALARLPADAVLPGATRLRVRPRAGHRRLAAALRPEGALHRPVRPRTVDVPRARLRARDAARAPVVRRARHGCAPTRRTDRRSSSPNESGKTRPRATPACRRPRGTCTRCAGAATIGAVGQGRPPRACAAAARDVRRADRAGARVVDDRLVAPRRRPRRPHAERPGDRRQRGRRADEPDRPKPRLLTIRLISQATRIPAGSRLELTLAGTSTAQNPGNLLYLVPVPQRARITLRNVSLTIPALRTPVSR